MSPSRSLRAVPSSVGEARRFVERSLSGVPYETREAAVLMTSELATNCVVHAGGEFTIDIEVGPTMIRVEISDLAPGDPVAERPDPEEPRGRGLFIVERLSDDWGVERHGDGKTVWFDLAVSTGQPEAASAQIDERVARARPATQEQESSHP